MGNTQKLQIQIKPRNLALFEMKAYPETNI